MSFRVIFYRLQHVQTNLELVEGIMLRLIQNDHPIACDIIDDATYPVDVPDDIKKLKLFSK